MEAGVLHPLDHLGQSRDRGPLPYVSRIVRRVQPIRVSTISSEARTSRRRSRKECRTLEIPMCATLTWRLCQCEREVTIRCQR